MSDNDAKVDPPAPASEGIPPEGSQEDTEQWDEDRAKAELRKKNSENQSLRQRLKDAEAKAAKLDEIEDAKKPEIERITTERDTAVQKSQGLEAKLLRHEVALSKGLTANQAARLQGSTLEELEADADELLEMFGQTAPTPPSGERPKETLRPGNAPSVEPVELDPSALVADLPRL